MLGESTICYHYCGLDKFVSIVRNKTLRLGNIFYMNDSKEVSWFFDVARKRIEEYLGDEDESSSGGRQQNVLVKLNSLLEKQQFYHIYAVCFSRKKDDLSQWRGYADDGRGVTLGIDIENLRKQTNCPLLERVLVNYDKEEQVRKVDKTLEPLLDLEESSDDSSSSSSSGSEPRPAIRVFRELASLAPNFKNPAFRHEEEVRLIVRTKVPPDKELDPARFDKGWFSDFPLPIEFFEGHRGLVPFTKIRLSKNAVQSVGFGPRFGGYEDMVALKLFCRKHLPNCQIRFYNSKASYR
jgi:hypothetical protein